ncbi:hypothetical protein NKR23_g5718 [Pleurostoma richardsiae]|uniref:Uncharacterized protein n=1 Tax=Pleurostoma richardsiae TaxID=41990 RepID=A0AA38VJ03_9PEZI|nr:hypothetical protein NKR23_g5718 [Pleurostoma richardsiae]
MRFTASLATLAGLAVGVAQADTGCTVDLSLYGSSADSGERIVYAILNRLYNSMNQSISSDCCGWTNTVSAPYSVIIYAGVEAGYSTDAELETVLDPWIGTYLRSGTATPSYSSSYPYDYLVTDVTCD